MVVVAGDFFVVGDGLTVVDDPDDSPRKIRRCNLFSHYSIIIEG